jgi:hypothetical protein
VSQILLPTIGSALLVLLVYDVLITVFHPQGRGGPINRTQNYWVWRLFRAFRRRRDGSIRADLLGFCGPILAVLTITTWGLVLITGFVLIYYPFIESFPASPAEAADRPLVKAIYYSGYVASTLGIGDVVASTSALRLLTIVEALGGFILIPISVTYVLAVYRELGIASLLALEIAGYFHRGTSEVWNAVISARPHAFDDWADRTTRGLLRITQAHSQYPILHYFHSSDPAQALLVQMGHLIRFQRISEAAGEGAAASPAFDALREAIGRHLHAINRDVVPKDFAPAYDRLQSTEIEERYGRILRYLLYEERREG